MNDEESWRWFGEAPFWNKYLPRAWRIVGQAYVGERFPSWIRTDDDHRWQDKAAAVFTAYLHLARYRLGWVDAPRGLVAWHARGRPGGDPVLDLMLRLDGDGLDWLVGWAAQFMHGREPADMIDVFNRRSGGYDPLHLSMHWAGPERESGAEPSFAAVAAGPGFLVSPTYLGWWQPLIRHLQREPQPTEVTVIPVGWIGTYTLSRTSGLPHATTEDVHLLGFSRDSPR